MCEQKQDNLREICGSSWILVHHDKRYTTAEEMVQMARESLSFQSLFTSWRDLNLEFVIGYQILVHHR
jgi:hypothetical protein